MPVLVPTPPRETCLVIVAGMMNPYIHSLEWYRVIGAIDEAELQAALTTPVGSTTPIGSQVQFGSPSFTVTCQPNQWWIQSTDRDSWKRMLDITALVFKKLNETPVTGYGLMAQRHLDTQALDVKSLIAASLVKLQMGFPNGKSTSSNIALNVVEEDYVVATSVQPSVLSEKAVFGLYHRQFDAPKLAAEYFDVGELLNGRLDSYLVGAENFFEQLVSAMARRVEGANL